MAQAGTLVDGNRSHRAIIRYASQARNAAQFGIPHEMLLLDLYAALRPVDATALAALPWPYLFHIVFGMTIFLLFPFSRLVHVWSGFASIFYLLRPYQVSRARRLNLPTGHNLPPQREGL